MQAPLIHKPDSSVRRRRRLAQTGEVAATLAVIFFVMFPLVWMILAAFKNQIDVYSTRLLFTPTLDNFRAVFATPILLGSHVWVSALVSFLTVAITIPLGAAASYVISRHRFWGRDALFLLILITQFVPAVVVAIPFFTLFRTLNLIDTPWALIIVYLSFTLPYAIWMLRGFFDSLPVEIEEASFIDGCNELQTLRYVTLPLIMPGLLVAAVFAFISAWNEFFFALILTRSDALTLPVTMQTISGPRGPMWEQVAAAGLLVMVPILVMSLFIRRYFVEGITVGAVK
ncbi:carbohydrate ABC transporter permease [Deinococcus hopiensis]|uniref:Multiple sugar transport system permease protein n=1 Tax=Deinococcus hopiensis KR-140 TaxID=695939 RepID=A0A1W1ULK8_9DEIO|nr:carbohydrate ABC transporter permease [Deinococcus hopiensis]SMB81903.1 multiple sugar transport system permease protein [Deinococcus hopiensis KR-140]